MPFTIGETVGTYRIVEQLGQGGMATVYKAYHPSLDRFVAIKVLHPAFKDDETFFIRFQREAQVVAKMEHPAIVPVYDFATHESEPYIVMKFIEGQTLKHYMKRKAPTLNETMRVMEAIASALDYAHRQGVLHRDIKPSNVMLDKDDTPYLTDFGLARIATSNESTMSHDVLIGTPNYISPEQARGDKTLGPGTDIYSLGIMLYEIVVGRVPFSADTPYAVVHDHIYKPLPLPSHVNPTVPKEVEIVLLKALAKTPEERYPSAGDMVKAFKEAVAASNMNELSATSFRIDRLSAPPTSSSSTPPPETQTSQTQDIASLVKAAVADAFEQRTDSRMGPTIPPVISQSYQTPPYMQRRPRRSGRGFWVVTGIAAFVFICIASLAVAINANQNPIVQRNPALVNSDENSNNALLVPEDLPPPNQTNLLRIDPNMSLQDAQEWVSDEPNNPIALLTLSAQQTEAGMFTDAVDNISLVMDNPDTPADILALGAKELAVRGFDDMAIRMWFTAYERAPDNEIIRDSAGQYIYRQFNGLSLEEVQDYRTYLESLEDSPFTLTMLAHALVASDPLADDLHNAQAERLLEQALELDETFAEAQLVYGDYYAEQGDFESANESWRFASSFLDSPEWVQQEAILKMNRSENED